MATKFIHRFYGRCVNRKTTIKKPSAKNNLKESCGISDSKVLYLKTIVV